MRQNLPMLRFVAPLLLGLAGTLPAQLTPIAPFTGQFSEGFEPGGAGGLGRVFANTGSIDTVNPAGGLMTFYGWLVYVGYTIYPMGGSNLFAGNLHGHVMITFDQPVQRFGGYFGTVGYLAGGHAILRDANGAILGTPTLLCPRGGWAWDGWDVGHGHPKIKTIELWCNDPYNSGGLTCLENLEADLALGSITTTPMGCGSLTLSVSGLPELGETLTLSLGSSAVAASGFLLGTPTTPTALPFCPGCTVGVNGFLLTGNSYTLDVPNSPAVLDVVIAAQGFRWNSGPCLGGFSVSNYAEIWIGLNH